MTPAQAIRRRPSERRVATQEEIDSEVAEHRARHFLARALWERTMTRQAVAAAAEALIDLLDTIDGDPDLEPDDEDVGVEDDADGFDEDQQTSNVPVDAVYALEPDEGGRRPYLGRSNLLSSFRTNGHPVRSFETGVILTTTGWASSPGAPA